MKIIDAIKKNREDGSEIRVVCGKRWLTYSSDYCDITPGYFEVWQRKYRARTTTQEYSGTNEDAAVMHLLGNE